MPLSPVSSITRASTRKKDEPLNILTFPTHERYETNLCKTGHNFYAFQAEGIKDWKTIYASVPENYTLLNRELGMEQIPFFLDLDLILSQNKFGQYQIASQLSTQLHLPLLSLEHTLPMPEWTTSQLSGIREMSGDRNVFISNFSRGNWGYDANSVVIRHCVDSELFKPSTDYGDVDRENAILSVVNDWINRDWCCGFQIWQRVTNGLPVRVVGDTNGLSQPATNTEELVDEYSNHRIFLNTSTVSPVPTAMLEAMSCGCAVVSTKNCMIPEIIEHGVNGFMTNDEKEMREYLEQLMIDERLATKMGEAARKTIQDKCAVKRFVSEWDNVLRDTADISFGL